MVRKAPRMGSCSQGVSEECRRKSGSDWRNSWTNAMSGSSRRMVVKFCYRRSIVCFYCNIYTVFQKYPDPCHVFWHKWVALIIIQFLTDCGWKVRVENFLRRLKETGSTSRRAGSDRPRTACTDEGIDAVNELVLSQEDAPQTHHTIDRLPEK